MKLHENKILLEQAIRFTADTMQIPAIYVEKDYWVTYALFTIFNSHMSSQVVFKGGTALSKCYNIIERFSEDIDLVVLKGENDNQTKKRLKDIGNIVKNILPEIEIEGVTSKTGRRRKTAHQFNKLFSGNYGQVGKDIILEATSLGYYEPYTTKKIISFIGQMMLGNNQSQMAVENGLLSFDLQVLEPSRTICEKIMSLVRFSYGENPIDNLKRKIRHTYDLHLLLKQDEFLAFFQSPDFYEMLLKVANDDIYSFKSNKWLNHHPKEALIFKDLERVWAELKTTYNNEFKTMVYGILPEAEAILATLKMIKERLEDIVWTMKLFKKSAVFPFTAAG